VLDSRHRFKSGFRRSNSRLRATYEQHPPETFTCEILEVLKPGCSDEELRKAEQHHIDRLRSWSPDSGFNIDPANWADHGPARQAYLVFRAAINADIRERHRKFREELRLKS